MKIPGVNRAFGRAKPPGLAGLAYRAEQEGRDVGFLAVLAEVQRRSQEEQAEFHRLLDERRQNGGAKT